MKYFDYNLRDPKELKRQFRILAFKHHPDKGGDKATFQAVLQEYETLIAMIEREAATASQPTPEQEEVINGFDWEIHIRPIFDRDGNIIHEYKAIYNGKTGELLNVPKATYTPTTNERFTELIEYLRDISGYKIGDFITLNGGKKVLANLTKPDDTTIAGHLFKEHIVVGNSHDYSSSFFVGQTSMMHRCENMFSTQNKQLKAYHTSNHEAHLKNIQSIFNAYQGLTERTHKNFEAFERRRVTSDEKNRLLRHVLALPEDTKLGEVSKRKLYQFYDLNEAIVRETRDIGQNALGLFQGVTYYTTHIQQQKEKVFGNLFGATAANNKRAYDYCKELIK